MTPPTSPVTTDASLHVVLVAPEIPWNTGNAGRTCVAAGAKLHLIAPLGFSLSDRMVRRSGVHQWRHVDPVVWPDWPSFAARIAEFGTPFYFSAQGTTSLAATVFPARTVLVFGNESGGLPEPVRAAHAERLIAIPMLARAGISLNLSTAVGIALYEVLRQRGG